MCAPQEGAIVASVGVGNDLSRSPRKPRPADQLIETELLWSGDLDGSVDGLANGCACNRAGDSVSRDGLDERVRKANRVAVGCGVGNTLDELEELGRMHDRIGCPDSLISFSCCQLRSEVAALRQTFCADDGKRNMMAHTSCLLGCEEVAGRGRRNRAPPCPRTRVHWTHRRRPARRTIPRRAPQR